MVTKFSGKFAIIMLKKHRKFCRCGLTHLDATPTFKNRPNTYASPCIQILGTLKLGTFSFRHTNASGTFVLGCNEEQTIFQDLAFNVSKILRQVKSVVPKAKILGLKSVDFHLAQQKNTGKIYKLAAHNETKIIKALDEMWKR